MFHPGSGERAGSLLRQHAPRATTLIEAQLVRDRTERRRFGPLYLPNVRREEVRLWSESIEFVDLERYRHSKASSLPLGVQVGGLCPRAPPGAYGAGCSMSPLRVSTERDARTWRAAFCASRHELVIAMIWIEHDVQMFADLAGRIHVLDHGRSITAGRPADVMRHAAVVEAYLGSRSSEQQQP